MRELSKTTTYFSYGDLLDSFEVQVLLNVEDNDYQGDTRVLMRDGARYGLVVFGWGSCSGCDALEAVNGDVAETTELRDELWSSVHWEDSAAEMLAYVDGKDWSLDFSYRKETADFLAQAYGLESAKADLADPAKATWLVEAGGQAVGYALAGPCGLPHDEVTPACGELKRLYLLKDWQNGGTGRRLFTEVMAWLERDGPRDLWIGVWSENFGAQRFYARQGFSKVGEYGFRVGSTTDHEFILRRVAQRTSTDA